MSPTVSVIIPLYNKEKWIEKTLSSLLNQSFTDWEAIIVDDGSTDSSVEVVEEFILKNPGNWVLIKNRNAGQCRTRNSGIAKATGEYVAFLDADDIWSKNKLFDQVQVLRKNSDVSLVICPYLIFSDTNRITNFRLVLHKNTKVLLNRWLRMQGYGAGTESTGMTRTSILREVGGFDENLSTSAGLYLTIELANRGRVVFSNKSLMAYRIHTGQWHSNTEILSRDMAALRTRPIKIMGKVPKAFDSWHSAYIEIAKTRQNGRLLSTLFSGNILSKTFLVRWVLALNILSRNVSSRIRGKFAKQICHFSPVEFQDFTSRF
ncbi:MAG: glycosyltransferase family 2 protein [Candidatus Planktophila sp.]|nr:glycosyltransferase family 2 protein [Candidatus Planktophila sp.]